MANRISISALSTEWVRARLTAKEAGVVVDPTGDQVELALTVDAATPVESDWFVGSWETDATVHPPHYYGRLLVGPGSGNITLSADTTYGLSVRVTDDPETPVEFVAWIEAY